MLRNGLSVNPNNPAGDPEVNDEPYWPRFTVGTRVVAVVDATSPSGDGFEKWHIGVGTGVNEPRREIIYIDNHPMGQTATYWEAVEGSEFIERDSRHLGRLALAGCADCGAPLLLMT